MNSRILALFVFFVAAAYPQARFVFKSLAPDSLELLENGKPVYVYNHGPILKPGFPATMSRAGYLHPVYLPDGSVITDDFNADHPHHRGISWMWPVVRVDSTDYDLWTVGAIKTRFVRWMTRRAETDSALLGVENGWFIGDRKVVKENVEILAGRTSGNQRTLEFTLRFEAVDAPVEIAGTTEGKKGFGGFCFRFAPRDGKKTVIRTEKGQQRKDGVNEAHQWASVEGLFNGHPGGGRLDDLAPNPGFPNNGWLIRFGFGFLNPSWPGLPHYTLVPGKPLELRYQVTLWSGVQ